MGKQRIGDYYKSAIQHCQQLHARRASSSFQTASEQAALRSGPLTPDRVLRGLALTVPRWPWIVQSMHCRTCSSNFAICARLRHGCSCDEYRSIAEKVRLSITNTNTNSMIDRRPVCFPDETARLRDDAAAAQATRELSMQPTRHCITSHQLVS